jgi:hypothetical protein
MENEHDIQKEKLNQIKCDNAVRKFEKRGYSKYAKQVLKNCSQKAHPEYREHAIRFLKQVCKNFKEKYTKNCSRHEEATGFQSIKKSMDVDTARNIVKSCTGLPEDAVFLSFKNDKIVSKALKVLNEENISSDYVAGFEESTISSTESTAGSEKSTDSAKSFNSKQSYVHTGTTQQIPLYHNTVFHSGFTIDDSQINSIEWIFGGLFVISTIGYVINRIFKKNTAKTDHNVILNPKKKCKNSKKIN